MDVLGKLEITCQKLTHLHGVVSEAGEVKVGKRLSREPMIRSAFSANESHTKEEAYI